MSKRPSSSTSLLHGPFGETFDVLEMASWMVDPNEASIVALVFDDTRMPQHAIVINDTPSPDAVHDVADVVERSLVRRPDLGALVIISVRPRQPCEPLDFDRLLDLTARFDAVGIELIDWYIWSGATRTSMRGAAGLPTRW